MPHENLTRAWRNCIVVLGGQPTPQTKYRLEVHVPKRQVLRLRRNAACRSALTSLTRLPTLLSPLALRMLEGDYAEGQTIAVDADGKGFVFNG